MKKLFDEKPVIACLITIVIFWAVLLIIPFIVGIVMGLLNITMQDQYPYNMVCEIVAALAGYIMIRVSNQEYIFKKANIKSFFKGLLTNGYTLVISTIAFLFWVMVYVVSKEGMVTEELALMGIDVSSYTLLSGFHIFCFVIYMISIGLAEEFFFRGVIAERIINKYKDTDKGIYKAIILSGVLFGLMHIANALSTGIVSASIQAIQTSFAGVIFVIAYYKSQNIWSVVFAHAYFDFFQLAMIGGIFGPTDQVNSVASAMNYGASNLVSLIPYLIVVLILMRKKNIAKIQENYN